MTFLKRLAAGEMGLTVASSSAAETGPFSEIERAIYELCPLVSSGALRLDGTEGLAKRGYRPVGSDQEGEWAELQNSSFRLRVGQAAGKPGCRVRYTGPEAVRLYEDLLRGGLARGLVFTDGHRKAPEAQFVMDTIANPDDHGAIGIISMFRVTLPGATGFAMTVFPSTKKPGRP